MKPKGGKRPKAPREKTPAVDKIQRLVVTLRQPNPPRRYVPSGRKGKR